MEINFKGTRYEPTPDILAQARKQLASIERYLGDAGQGALAYVELSQDVGSHKKGDIWRADVRVDYENQRFEAGSTKAKLDHAITTAMRDVGQEIRRARKRTKDATRKGKGIIKGFLRGFSR